MSVASTTSVVCTTPVDCPSMETIRPSPADQRPPADRSPSSSVRFHSDQIHPYTGACAAHRPSRPGNVHQTPLARIPARCSRPALRRKSSTASGPGRGRELRASDREAPHGAWPLVAAYFGTRGLHRPDTSNSVAGGQTPCPVEDLGLRDL